MTMEADFLRSFVSRHVSSSSRSGNEGRDSARRRGQTSGYSSLPVCSRCVSYLTFRSNGRQRLTFLVPCLSATETDVRLAFLPLPCETFPDFHLPSHRVFSIPSASRPRAGCLQGQHRAIFVRRRVSDLTFFVDLPFLFRSPSTPSGTRNGLLHGFTMFLWELICRTFIVSAPLSRSPV